jgi:hypothetical protein
MLIPEIPIIWILLLLSITGTFFEFLSPNKYVYIYPYIATCIVSVFFLLSYNLFCSDFLQYETIYGWSENQFGFLQFFQVDRLFQNIASLWQSFFDPRRFDLFVSFYQTISFSVLAYSIYCFCGKWCNTILFVSIFGSFQLQYLTMCSLRQGLSSSLSTLLLIALYKNNEISKNQALNLVKYLLLILFIVNAHWTGILLVPVIYASHFLMKTASFGKNARLRIALFSLLILTGLLGSILPVFYSRTAIYLEGASGFGARIYITAVIDFYIIFIVFFHARNNPNFALCQKLNQLIITSSILIILKIATLFGFTDAVRLVMGVNIIQILCLPELLDRLSLSLRILTVFIISLPYTVFLFVFASEIYKPIQWISF